MQHIADGYEGHADFNLTVQKKKKLPAPGRNFVPFRTEEFRWGAIWQQGYCSPPLGAYTDRVLKMCKRTMAKHTERGESSVIDRLVSIAIV